MEYYFGLIKEEDYGDYEDEDLEGDDDNLDDDLDEEIEEKPKKVNNFFLLLIYPKILNIFFYFLFLFRIKKIKKSLTIKRILLVMLQELIKNQLKNLNANNNELNY